MLRTLPAAFATLALFAGSVAATADDAPKAKGPVTCSIDDVHSMAMFRVQHMGAGAFWGRFNDVDGSFTFTPGTADGMKFDVAIKTESVDSGNDKLNQHLRSPDFFASKDFPSMTFKSTGVKMVDATHYAVSGDLTLHGVTKPITANVEFVGMADGGKGARAGFEATFTIKRSDFGMKYGVDKGAIGDEVRVVVGLEGTSK
jgi:polyisoprenoid-binding protein YceI